MGANLLKQLDEAVRRAAGDAIAQGAHRRYLGSSSKALADQIPDLVGGGRALLCCSGSAALEIGLRGMGVGAADRVLMAAYDYPGNAWAIDRVGAKPVLVDVLPGGWRLDVDSLRAALERHPQCRALVVSHLHGQTQDIATLHAICRRHGLALIEDCCQSIGARRGDRLAGASGDLVTISFGGGKQLAAGRGGALVVRDASLLQHCKIAAGAGSGPYASSEVHAALVLAQIPWLERMLARCRSFFKAFASVWGETAPADVRMQIRMPFAEEEGPAFYQAGMLLEPTDRERDADRISRLRSSVIASLRTSGIPAGPGFDGLHRRSGRRCDKPVALANAASAAARTLVIPYTVACTGEVAPGQLAELLADALRNGMAANTAF